ncbi:hypothetical protein SDC9_195743 [bioreactor metagenome]|uniref:Uncharacterized protein n=1 Tax=bioreactor metagenome TaxID=1076179 RepID=A0A645IA61_9ZZZZ
MREAHCQVQLGTLCSGLVAHANQRQLLLEAFSHALDHVVDQLADGTGQSVSFTGVVGGSKGQLAVVVADGHQAVQRQRQIAALALDLDGFSVDGHIHACGDGHVCFCYARHFSISP